MKQRTVAYALAAAVTVAVVAVIVHEDREITVPRDAVSVCVLDLDDHPTRDEVTAVLGEPVDVDHDAGSTNLDGTEWLPATDTLTWADGDTVTFDAGDGRASSWVVDDPRVC